MACYKMWIRPGSYFIFPQLYHTLHIHSSIGHNTNEAYCQSTAIQQTIHPCHLPKFTEVYNPPEIQCNFHQSIIDSWNTYPLESTTPIAVYTDGSLKTEEQPTTLTPHSPPKTVSSAVVFYEKITHPTPWQNRKVVAIQLRLPPNTNSTNYTAEVLAATIATALPGTKETHIYTDALGLISSLTKTTKLNTLSLLENQGLIVVVLVMSSVTYLTLSIMLVMDMVYLFSS